MGSLVRGVSPRCFYFEMIQCVIMSLLHGISVINLLFCEKMLHFFFRSRRKCNIVHLFLNKFCYCYKSVAVTMRNKPINSLPHVPGIVNLSKLSLKVFRNIKFMKIES